jgi:putative tryptophan/tyrosine transport system substrate-binding protein
VVGFLNVTSAAQSAERIRGFRQGLSETGFVEGQNVAIDYHWADYRYDRLPALAVDLVRREVSAIVATSIAAARAAKAVTATIPIVFYVGRDPVQTGLVASLNRPGGNLTGVSSMFAGGADQKRLELLHDVVPTAGIVAVLVNPSNPNNEAQVRELEAAARTLGVQTHMLHASAERDFEALFATAVRLRLGALVIGGDLFLTGSSEQLAALTARHALPAIHQSREFAMAGGLMSYGGSFTDSYRQVGIYTGRILKGEKPGDLPVQQTAKVELVINLKSAKTLGLTVPLPLLARADEVIE